MNLLKKNLMLSAAMLPLCAMAGEIVSDTFMSRLNGRIEIPLAGGRWQASDTERTAPTAIAALKLAAPVSGTHPTCDVTSAPGMATTAGHEEIAEVIAKGMRDSGMDLGPMELRRIGGRPVIRFNTVLNRQGGAAKGDAYVLRGEKDYFFVICAANNLAYDSARESFEDLVASIRY